MEIKVLNGKFALSCRYMENERVKRFPRREFKKKFSMWALAPTYDNAVVLLSEFAEVSTKEAVALAQQIVDSTRPKEITDAVPDCVLEGLLPHQQRCINKSFPHEGYAILHRPRCRKTATTIRLACARFLAGQIDKIVVIVPNSIKAVWEAEIPKRSVAPYTAHVYEAGKGKHLDKWMQSSQDGKIKKLEWLIVSVEGMSAGSTVDQVTKFIGNSGPRTMIAVDESTRIKNHQSSRTNTIWELGQKVGFRNILTGSEITRSPSDLFAQFRFLGVHTLGYDSFYAFRNRYVVMGGFECKKEIGAKNVDELMAKITQYADLVKTSDIVDLPEKTFTTRMIEPSKEQIEYTRQIKKYMEAETPEGEMVSVKTAMTGMLRCQQLAGGFFPDVKTNEDGTTTTTMIPLKKNPKLDELMEILSEEPGKVVIWARFIPEIEAIRDLISKKYGEDMVVTFYGLDDLDQRNANKLEFQEGKARYFVGNPVCGSMGLELSAASLMIYFSMDFQYESRVQSLERCTNLDKKNEIGIIDLFLNIPADRTIMQSTAEKKDIADWVEDAIHSGQFSIV